MLSMSSGGIECTSMVLLPARRGSDPEDGSPFAHGNL